MTQVIQYITRKELDVSKYDTCIANATNSRIYAYSWYLDIVADDWDILVLDDYLAVMPLPTRRKYFIQYIYQPAWIQQLGVFSVEAVDENMIKSFLKVIPDKFKKISTNLNDENYLNSSFISKRDNYVLNLNTNYESLYSNYSKNRKRILKKIDKASLFINESEKHQIIFSFYRQYIFAKSGLKEKDLQNLDLLLTKCYNLNKAVIVSAFTADNENLGGIVFLKDNNRFYYLVSAISNRGKDRLAMTFVVDYIIKKYASEKLVFDFEGSMIPGVASFFKSFGAENNPYYVFEKPLSLW